MFGRRTSLLAVGLLVVAGCLGPTETGDERANGLEASALDAPAFGLASPLPIEPGQRSLESAPEWVLGEWWTYELTHSGFQTSERFTVIVAGAGQGQYLVGVPADEAPVLPFIMHAPALGQVDKTNLTYEAHDEAFELLRFPLEQGRAWDGLFWGLAPMEVTVRVVDGATAELHLVSGSTQANYTYDAEVGQITWLAAGDREDPTWELELVGHGTGYEGDVRVPYDQDLDLCHGRALVVLGIEACQSAGPAPPTGSFEVPDDHSHATAAIVASQASPAGPAAGITRIMVTDPNDGQHVVVLGPAASGGLLGFHVEDPGGTWTYETEALSGGSAIVEGVTYDAIDVRLPAGCLVASTQVEVQATHCEG